MSELSNRRAVILLGTAAFASVASMRVADPLLPQVANEFGVTAGRASVISTAFAIAYGVCQVVYGMLGDRFGKFRLVAIMTVISALTVSAAGFAGSIAALGMARLAAGATAAAIVPLSMAFIGDHVAYRNRQATLARFLSGTVIGVIAGQVFGGILGDLIGWRMVFPMLGAVFFLVGLLLMVELGRGRLPPPKLTGKLDIHALIDGHRRLLRRPWARVVLATVFIEGFLFYGAFAFIGADLHQRFTLGYGEIGLLLGCTGLGGLAYTLAVGRLVRLLGEHGLARFGGGAIALGLVMVTMGPLWLIPIGLFLLGIGLSMLHNTLQTNATQMAPDARGLAVSAFANALFLGQAAGIWLSGALADRLGFTPVFLAIACSLVLLSLSFAKQLDAKRRDPRPLGQ